MAENLEKNEDRQKCDDPQAGHPAANVIASEPGQATHVELHQRQVLRIFRSIAAGGLRAAARMPE
jgi:hypothetical protein